ncbi:hypothetical protein HK405_015450, partial [Cladochytrium tenue]
MVKRTGKTSPKADSVHSSPQPISCKLEFDAPASVPLTPPPSAPSPAASTITTATSPLSPASDGASSPALPTVRCCGATFTVADFVRHNTAAHFGAPPTAAMGPDAVAAVAAAAAATFYGDADAADADLPTPCPSPVLAQAPPPPLVPKTAFTWTPSPSPLTVLKCYTPIAESQARPRPRGMSAADAAPGSPVSDFAPPSAAAAALRRKDAPAAWRASRALPPSPPLSGPSTCRSSPTETDSPMLSTRRRRNAVRPALPPALVASKAAVVADCAPDFRVVGAGAADASLDAMDVDLGGWAAAALDDVDQGDNDLLLHSLQDVDPAVVERLVQHHGGPAVAPRRVCRHHHSKLAKSRSSPYPMQQLHHQPLPAATGIKHSPTCLVHGHLARALAAQGAWQDLGFAGLDAYG